MTGRRRTTFLERAAMTTTVYGRATRFLQETIWQVDPNGLDRWRRLGVMSLRVLYLVGRSFYSSRVQLQASSLTYVSMLALVPAFAVVFSFFQSFGGLSGIGERVQEFFLNSISLTPELAGELRQKLPELLKNVQTHVQTGSGIAGAAFVFLVITIVTLLGSIEKALNDVWGVKRARSFAQKFIVYWAVATLGPVILGIALVAGSNVYAKASRELSWSSLRARLSGKKVEAPPRYRGATGAIQSQYEVERPHHETSGNTVEYVMFGKAGDVEERGSKLMGVFLTAIAFTLLYAMMPNTRVRWKPAALGGFVAAFLWASSRWALTGASSALVSYNTIYGSLASVPIMMFWLYVSWVVVILGAELTFAIQNMGAQGREELAEDASERTREVVALRIATAIADAFDAGAPPPSLSQLAARTGAPIALCSDIVFHLCEDGLLRELELDEEERGYLPAKPLDRITFADVVRSIRERRGTSFLLEGGPEAMFVEEKMDSARSAEEAVAGLVTLERAVRELKPRTASVTQAPEHAAPIGGGTG